MGGENGRCRARPGRRCRELRQPQAVASVVPGMRGDARDLLHQLEAAGGREYPILGSTGARTGTLEAHFLTQYWGFYFFV